MVKGTTQLVAIVGTPIAQVRSPENFNAHFARTGADVVMIPMDVRPGQVGDLVALMRGWQNLRGIVVTVPHKQAFAKHVDTLSARASALAAVNVVRRDRDGGLAGDMADGLGFVNAAREHGFVARGCRGLVVGAGGAGSAIAYALAEAGMASIALHDVDEDRIESLRATIARAFPSVHLERGADTPAGFDLIVNATPIGMDGQSLPLDRGWMQRLEPRTLVADAVTSPAMTPFLALAQSAGCRVQTGPEMARAQMEYLGAFLGVMPAMDARDRDTPAQR